MTRTLALDAGQTGIRARVLFAPNSPGVHQENIRVCEPDLASHGIRTDLPLATQLADIVRAVAADVGTIEAVAVGSTGFTGGEDLSDLRLLGALGVNTVLLAHDSTTAYLGALGAQQGVVVAAGTGVVTLAVGESCVARVDGWGNIMGDAGSGYWFGRAALDGAMRAYDGRGPKTVLLERLREEFGDVESAYIALQADPARVRRTASFGRWVTAAAAEGDLVAREVCRRGAAELALAATTGLDRAGIDSGVAAAVCTIGGVFGSAVIEDAFSAELRRRRPAAEHIAPKGDGLDGAQALFALGPANPLGARVTRFKFD